MNMIMSFWPSFPARQHIAEPDNQSSALLSLQPELRNTIHRLCLKNERDIAIRSSTWTSHQPPLLRTCHQIRSEALKIFYEENKFTVDIEDWDGTISQRLLKLRLLNSMRKKMPHFRILGSPSWTNLKDWVRQYHASKNIRLLHWSRSRNADLTMRIVGAVFEMARQGKKRDWEKVESLIDTQRVILEGMDSRWQDPTLLWSTLETNTV